jgi:quercetin dioxygenase-like cupin family protein
MKPNIPWIAGIALMAILVISCKTDRGENQMNNKAIFAKGQQAGNQIFSNTVWVNMLETDAENTYDTQVYNVTFEPAGRTHWHSHPGGQILLVTHGTGYYQEKGKPAQLLQPGDRVSIPPHVNHWHGAAPDCQFIHLGMSTQVHLGPAEWFGPVTNEEYRAATSQQQEA